MLDFSKNSHLIIFNLINKYKLKSILEKPQLSSVMLSMHLKQKCINNFEIVKIYIISYLVFNTKPFFSTKSHTALQIDAKRKNQTYKIINVSLKTFFLKEQSINNILNNFPINTEKKHYRFKRCFISKSDIKSKKQTNFAFESKLFFNRFTNCFLYQRFFNVLSVELKDLSINVRFNFCGKPKNALSEKYLTFNTLSS